MTTQELLTTLRNRGVVLSVASGCQLRCNAPRGVLTMELKTLLEKQKPQIIELVRTSKQDVIRAIASPGSNPNGYLNSHEFTDRYLALMKAWRNGVIDDKTKDEGLDFLLDYWSGGLTGNGTSNKH